MIALQALINQVVPYHANYPLFLKKHLGKSCQINLGNQSVCFYFHQSGVVICEDEPDGKISMDLEGFLSFVGFDCKGKITIEKDTYLCQDLVSLLSLHDIHQETLLFSIFPENLAVILIESMNLGHLHYKNIQKNILSLISSYLQESELVGTKKQIDGLYEKTLRLNWLIESL